MPFLSPAKLLVILVVALFVLGPDKLPKVARQIGSLWADFGKLRERLEADVRGSFPDLPSTDAITRAVHSPLAFLDGLAEPHGPESDPVPSDLDVVTDPNRPAGTVEIIEQSAVPPVESPSVIYARPDLVGHDIRVGDGPGPSPEMN